ncbi:Innexin [Fasciola hepatica]|uniref:Innexin n=1 Tax=Fasciola hepatica TaxID=6192 RepID=A0A4E0QZP1_FASHE|nr:Innexin [Fasciola hepatica]
MGFDLGKGFIDSIISAQNGAFSHLEDFADRLSHFFTSGILLMFAGVTMANVYFLRPIACTLPTAPDNKFNEFAEAVCWVKGTTPLRSTDPMPLDAADWAKVNERSGISFYQWVPFCLSVQAMLFFLPHAVWQSMARYTMGENLECVLSKARDANRAEDQTKRQKCISIAAFQLFRLSRQHCDHRSSKWARWQRRAVQRVPGANLFVASKRMGNRVMVIYLIVKALYLLNSMSQLYIIKTFLGYRGSLFTFGDSLIGTLTAKQEWGESEFFPRQTYCPVSVRQLGANNNVYTAICVLPVNMFNEKIYIFLWLWIAFVTVATSISLMLWLVRSLFHRCQTTFVRDFLILSVQSQKNEPGRDDHPSNCPACNVQPNDSTVDRFITECVRNDGTFLIRMIRSNAGDVAAGEILNCWWHLFANYEQAECAEYEKKRLNYAIAKDDATYGNLNQPDGETQMRKNLMEYSHNLV